jgi:transcriptional regulator with PAS, ATPase and Fis domain
MPLEVQKKLLRTLQEKEIAKPGSIKSRKIDFRVICSTTRNLKALVRTGAFSHELFQRLNVIPIKLSPLRENPKDVPVLVDYFIKKLPHPLNQLKLTSEASRILETYRWPGNVRELSNLVEYLSVFCESHNAIDVSDLPFKDKEEPASAPENTDFYLERARFEREFLSKAYEKAKGNISHMANHIRIDRTYLYTKLREHNLYPKEA